MTQSPSIRSVIEAIEIAAGEFGRKPAPHRESEVADIKLKLGYAVEMLRQAERRKWESGFATLIHDPAEPVKVKQESLL